MPYSTGRFLLKTVKISLEKMSYRLQYISVSSMYLITINLRISIDWSSVMNQLTFVVSTFLCIF